MSDASKEWPPKLRFQVNGVIALWARKHGLSVGTDEINELIACLGLEPEQEVDMTPKEAADGSGTT